MNALEKLERLQDLAPGEARDVEDEWPLTLGALRAGVADETPVFDGLELGFLRGRLEAELDERLHAQTEVAPS